ncbi:MAG: GNAT family N-acetyltransferase [Spirochaetes bacterium]|jgi:RimJ/RimL family protein N-acetyltransferase|nr:GNAT family N-acetyltransferase [Spirochaetota bacterium]
MAGERITIDCGKCLLRPWAMEDIFSLVENANNRRVSMNLRDCFPYPYGMNDARSWIDRASSEEPMLEFAIVADGRAAGGIGVLPGTDISRRSAEVGYWLGENFWGRGIAAEALSGMVGYSTGKLGMARLFALPFAHNLASRRVLEKCGFALEGILRKSAFKDGAYYDQALYSLLRD